MDNRLKELIAIGASVTSNCQPCLRYHVGKARESGADDEEILEAMSVAKSVRKGAIAKMDQFAATLLKAAETTQEASEEGCGCGS
ncbi:MAG: carboxymuconolactone decarboxylase family protein [Nitrospirae bacterium]|nr:carboxymuconolactone decarboxylase family protein [Nitrospirota bacterium]